MNARIGYYFLSLTVPKLDSRHSGGRKQNGTGVGTIVTDDSSGKRKV